MRRHPHYPLAAMAALLLASWARAAAPPAPPPAVVTQRVTPAPAAKTDPAPEARPAAAGKVDPEYVLGPGDVLAINVWHEPDLTRSLPIRPDGRISLPLVGELRAQGLTADALQAEISDRLRHYIDHPSVTVMVQEAESQRFIILGMVVKPGTYTLTSPTTVLDAIAEAGGLRDFAHGNKIYVLRKRASDGVEMRYPFNYNRVSLGVDLRENIQLQAKDVVVVP